MFLFVFYKLDNKKMPSNFLIPAVVISYAFTIFSNLNALFVLLIAAIIGAALNTIKKIPIVKCIMRRLFAFTPDDKIWGSVLDLDEGTYAKITLRNKTDYYVGIVYVAESSDKNEWITLSGYSKYDEGGKKIDDGTYNVIALNLADVDSIKFDYPDVSKVKDYIFGFMYK